MDTSPVGVRPYRSHKIRACDHCRRRKQRCIVPSAGEPCQLCSQKSISCSYISTPSRRKIRVTDNAASFPTDGRTHVSVTHETSTVSQNGSIQVPTTSDNLRSKDNIQQSTHIVGPDVSEDAHIIEQYMTPSSTVGSRSNRVSYNVFSADRERPILYTKIDRRRAGLMMSERPGLKQRIIMEQILAGSVETLLQIYLSELHSCFPVIDREEILKTNQNVSTDALDTLLCTVYAITLICWNESSLKRRGACPDQRFFWNLSVKALSEDFLAPALSTLQAVLVDLAGRPSYSITGNVINIGRAVSLANSLGLNKDCSKWQVALDERQLRTRVWWGVLIHDIWGSYTYGVPPNTDPKYYDVPLPMTDDSSTQNDDGFGCFVSLCKLTKILAGVLPLLYDVHIRSWKDIRRVIRTIETELEDWQEGVAFNIQQMTDSAQHLKGSSNLHLSYLSLRMLICRLSLHAIGRSSSDDVSPELLVYHQAECKRSALAVLQFVESLEAYQLTGFWLPYCAYYLTSATTLLLRFAVETIDDQMAVTTISSVRNFVRRLQTLRDDHNWELGTHCLAHCEAVVEQLTKRNADQELATENYAGPADYSLGDDDLVNRLDTSLLVSFGNVDGQVQERDLWEMLNIDGTGDQNFVF